MSGYHYRTVEFTDTFLDTYAAKYFSAADRSAFRKALRLLDEDERHPPCVSTSFAVTVRGSWSASAGRALRMTFAREADGRKRMLTCSRHYDR